MDFRIHTQRVKPYRVYFTLLIFLGIAIYTSPAAAQCTGGTCTSGILNAGSSDFSAGGSGTVCVAGNHSKNITTNHHNLTICIRSTANYGGTITIGSGTVVIENYGNFTGQINNYTSSVTVHNYSGATFSPSSNINMSGTLISYTGSTFSPSNAFTINTTGSMTIQSGVTASFSGSLTVDGTFETSSNISVGSILTNNTTGTITVRNSTLTVNNTLSNNGLIQLQNAGITINSGNLINNKDITNIGTTCSKVEIIGGTSANNSGANFGTSGPAASTPKTDICTRASSSSAGTGFTTTNSGSNTFNVSSPHCSCSIIPLPVSLVHFKGTETPTGILLEWQTASEKDNSHFVVERSANGTDFTAIAEIKGKGTTQGLSSYKAIDTKPLNQKTYYRLIQVDQDGTVHAYSKLIVLNRTTASTRMSLSPNPSSSEGVVQLQFSHIVSKASVQILDLQGKLHHQYTYTEPQQSYELPVQALPKGVYLIRIQFTSDKERATQTQRFVKL